MSSSGVLPWIGNSASPKLMPSPAASTLSPASAVTIRPTASCASSASVSGSSSANSSPPMRKAKSLARIVPSQQRGDGLQRAVARRVAVGVVDALEVVEVAEGQDEAPAVAQGALDLGAQLAHEGAPVEQPGERVAIGLRAQLLDVPGGDHGHHRLVGEHPQGLQARRRGQQPVGRVVGPDAPDDLARLVVERHHEPVVVPGVRPAPVHGRGEGAALRRARDGGRLRDQEAALDLEGGVQQRTDLVDRDAPLRRRGERRPSRRRRAASAARSRGRRARS